MTLSVNNGIATIINWILAFAPLGQAAPRGWRREALVKYEGKEYLYLNNELLLRGLAKRMAT